MNDQENITSETLGRILVIDDDPLLSELVHYHFTPLGFQVEKCSSFDEFLGTDACPYRLIIIDIAFDNKSGTQIIEMLHQSPMTDDIPIIICTKADNTSDIVLGLNAGADDFITRPFAVGELIARAKALMRRLG